MQNTEASESKTSNPSGPAHAKNQADGRDEYSLFTTWEKRYIVALIALVAWFSTLSSFIYYPVLSLVAADLQTSIANINLTVTTYMVVSAIAPAIVGDAADQMGRRPLYIITLTLYVAANLGIALQHSFVGMLLLRMLQSAGISGTFSIAYGVVADISPPKSRGSCVSALSFGITTAPSIGPLIGGVMGDTVGWRWIFWFLFIVAGLSLACVVLTLPETARGLVGNGSIKPAFPTVSPMSFMKHWASDASAGTERGSVKWRVPNPFKCISMLCQMDTLVVIAAGSILYMVYCCLHTSLSSLFIETYNINDLQAGLIYLPFGAGSIISTVFSGKMLDRDFQSISRKYNLAIGNGDDISQFPIEEARLRHSYVLTAVVTSTVIGYGWALKFATHIAIPLVLQFFIGLAIQTCFNIGNTLLVDINQKAPSTAQAAFNLVRCTLAAGSIAALQYIIDAINVGWTFTLFGILTMFSLYLFYLERKHGMAWRQRRT